MDRRTMRPRRPRSASRPGNRTRACADLTLAAAAIPRCPLRRAATPHPPPPHTARYRPRPDHRLPTPPTRDSTRPPAPHPRHRPLRSAQLQHQQRPPHPLDEFEYRPSRILRPGPHSGRPRRRAVRTVALHTLSLRTEPARATTAGQPRLFGSHLHGSSRTPSAAATCGTVVERYAAQRFSTI